uniref:Uncharacterized protein n=1 Tax=Tanacetum cinerariifolium TaxID=118510 RepID=A0A699QQ13_TANCI|nr:hypothetical protein [Tanacetum cinerariifolium]
MYGVFLDRVVKKKTILVNQEQEKQNNHKPDTLKGEDGGGFIAAEPRQWWLAAAVVMAVGSVVLVADMVAAAWCRQWGGEAAGGVGVEVEMAAEVRRRCMATVSGGSYRSGYGIRGVILGFAGKAS